LHPLVQTDPDFVEFSLAAAGFLREWQNQAWLVFEPMAEVAARFFQHLRDHQLMLRQPLFVKVELPDLKLNHQLLMLMTFEMGLIIQVVICMKVFSLIFSNFVIPILPLVDAGQGKLH